jgi:hypothetical protein
MYKVIFKNYHIVFNLLFQVPEIHLYKTVKKAIPCTENGGVKSLRNSFNLSMFRMYN